MGTVPCQPTPGEPSPAGAVIVPLMLSLFGAATPAAGCIAGRAPIVLTTIPARSTAASHFCRLFESMMILLTKVTIGLYGRAHTYEQEICTQWVTLPHQKTYHQF